MFFTPKKDEYNAQQLFRKNCVSRGLTIHLSTVALEALKRVAEATVAEDDTEISERDVHTLGRRGLIRTMPNGTIVMTQMGLLVLALAEAGGLVTVRSKSGRVKAVA